MRAVVLSFLLASLGCGRAMDPSGPGPSSVDATPALGVASIDPAPEPTPHDAGTLQAAPSTKLVPDEEVGPLLARLSETPGDFPSENYVSNELSLLDVASALRDAIFSTKEVVGTHGVYNFKPGDLYGVDERARVIVRDHQPAVAGVVGFGSAAW